jgi:hypothetical protein
MNSQNILNVCLKVVGLFHALKALNMLPSTISQLIITWDAWKFAPEDDSLGIIANYKIASIVSILIPILVFTISVIIVFKSKAIINFIMKRESEQSFTVSEPFSINALDISVRLFGFFSILLAIPHLSSLLSRYLIMKDQIKLYQNTVKIELATSGIATILYVSVGLLLIFSSQQISKKLSKIGDGEENHLEDET